jgi:hypothetical protein
MTSAFCESGRRSGTPTSQLSSVSTDSSGRPARDESVATCSLRNRRRGLQRSCEEKRARGLKCERASCGFTESHPGETAPITGRPQSRVDGPGVEGYSRESELHHRVAVRPARSVDVTRRRSS